ncbi:hypothetical protein AIOL_001824 [Candidatus Rhodobacter oscarellae]|uniref:Uncharacterized protein n=1 Tax=Candidatus Rhodobacter oscarellae TaxID=1675527 RepID=A0A0J9E2F3_9RHOB|nr:hypothetical protein AIOL_001824 [Candidatus Rhodobacter lobularis]
MHRPNTGVGTVYRRAAVVSTGKADSAHGAEIGGLPALAARRAN